MRNQNPKQPHPWGAKLCALTLAGLGLGIACQSNQPQDGSPGDQGAQAEAAAPVELGKRPADIPRSGDEVAFDGFAMNAFPPTLPPDETHGNGWNKDDCLLCHESGNATATAVKHKGMAKSLLLGKCRTCHIPGPATAARNVALDADGGLVQFQENAFPPTLPHDESHDGAWLRDDCLACHELGSAEAPKLVHEGMAPSLLDARCRSCHLPSVSSAEADTND